MKLTALSFDGKLGDDASPTMPTTVAVEMTIDEAAAIATLFGKLNSHGQDRLGGYEKVEGIYACLVGDVFNRYWEDGIGGYIAPFTLDHINDPR